MLEDLYQQVILDHNRAPRNFRKLERAPHHAEGYNPLCGDRVTVYVRLADDTVTDISFEGSGCAISKASASLMTEVLKGKQRAEVDALFEGFHALVTGQSAAAGKAEPDLGKLRVFSGVREFPMRVKCATLAWHTMRAALEDSQKVASTE